MKKGLMVITALLLFAALHAQKKVGIESLRDHIGDSVTVCSKIYSGIFLDRNKDSLTLLNAGGRYPDAPLTIVIPMNVRREFEIEPEAFFKEREVCVTGRLILYKEKPQIIIYDQKQIIARVH